MKNTFTGGKLYKDNLMFLVILGLWISAVAYYDPRILTNINEQESLSVRISILCFIVLLDLFWLYGIYHLTISIFSAFCKTPKVLSGTISITHPKVAILYTTKNDFKETAVVSCLGQDYDNYDVYILDDSTEVDILNRIHEFTSNNPGRLFLIRRDLKEGFKAGNLNHALNMLSNNYEYFAVTDADGILPRNFLSGLLPYFSIDKSVGFVQANQRSNPRQTNKFSRDLSLNTDLHWKCYLPAKNYFGFVMFYGHGALIRTSVWKEVGGFPDTITEDLAFSSIIREKGYKGIFVDNVICYEEFPENYLKYRKRNERWVKGTTEYLTKWFPSLCLSGKVAWFEKLDILISAGVLLMAAPFILFLFIAAIIIPLSTDNFGLHIPLANNFILPSYSIPSHIPILKYELDWTKGLFLIMSVTAFAQIIPAVYYLASNPGKMFRYCAQFTFVCLSTIVDSAVGILSFMLTRKSYFPVTGSTDILMKIENGATNLLEIVFALLLCIVMIKTSNIWLFGISFSLLLDSLVYRYRWDSRVVYLLVHVPFSILLILILCSIFFWL